MVRSAHSSVWRASRSGCSPHNGQRVLDACPGGHVNGHSRFFRASRVAFGAEIFQLKRKIPMFQEYCLLKWHSPSTLPARSFILEGGVRRLCMTHPRLLLVQCRPVSQERVCAGAPASAGAYSFSSVLCSVQTVPKTRVLLPGSLFSTTRAAPDNPLRHKLTHIIAVPAVGVS